MDRAANTLHPDSPFTVRPLHEHEVEDAIALIHQSVRQISPQDYPPEQVKAILKMYDAKTLAQYMVLVVQAQSQLVGVAAFQVPVKVCFISAVFTHPDWLRQGVGRSLVQEIERRALGQGAIWVAVASSLTADTFYKALGYKSLGKGTLAENVACIHLHKQLRPLTTLEQVSATVGKILGWMLLGAGAVVLMDRLLAIVALILDGR
ncbi:MAG: GNAT family N-acetyltransferase [Cyanobacteria bacterium P01_G01_bin.54]